MDKNDFKSKSCRDDNYSDSFENIAWDDEKSKYIWRDPVLEPEPHGFKVTGGYDSIKFKIPQRPTFRTVLITTLTFFLAIFWTAYVYSIFENPTFWSAWSIWIVFIIRLISSGSGFECVTASKNHIEYEFGYLGISFKKWIFKSESAYNLRLASQIQNDLWRINLWKKGPSLYRSQRLGMLVFDYGVEPFAFLCWVTPIEAHMILDSIKKQITQSPLARKPEGASSTPPDYSQKR